MPCRCSVAPRTGERLLWFGGVVDQDEIGTAPGQHPAGRGGQPVALTSGDKLLHGVAVRVGKIRWNQPPIMYMRSCFLCRRPMERYS